MSWDRWRHTSWMALILCLLVGLAACTGSTSTLPQDAAERALSLWHALPADQGRMLQELVEEWGSAQEPPVSVTLHRSTDEEALHLSLLAAAQTEVVPDLALVRPFDLAAYVETDSLLPLDSPDALNEAERKDFYQQFFAAGRPFPDRETLYAWPLDRNQTLLLVNRERVEALGSEMPPESWEELLALCARHRDDSNEPCFAAYPSGEVAVLWLWSNAAEITDEAGRLPGFGGETGQGAMRWLAALRAIDAVLPVSTRDEAVEAFTSGRALFVFDSSDHLGDYEAAIDAGLGLSLMPPPSVNDRPVTLASGNNVAIFRSSPEREELALDLLRYLTSSEVNARWAGAIDAFPVRRSALDRLEVTWPESSPRRDVALWLPHARSTAALAAWPEIEQILSRAMMNTVTGQESPEQALDEAARLAQGVLQP